MANAVQEAFLEGLTNPEMASDNAKLAMFIRQRCPGASTTAASVSSMKSRMKANIAMGAPMPNGSGPAAASMTWASLPEGNDTEETVEEAKARINVRYKAMARMSARLIAGNIPSLIISGPPGLGKSWTVKEELAAAERTRFDVGGYGASGDEDSMDDGEDEEREIPDSSDASKMYDYVTGTITAVGLFQALWYMRKGGVLILDDVDSVFRDEDCLNLLKGALDSSPTRIISWRKNAQWLEDYGIDKTFDFQGHVIFLTNIDFEGEITKGSKMAEHFKALIDRSMYLCLTLRTRRDFMIRIRQVAEGEDGMLMKHFGLTAEQADEVLDFVADNQTRFYALSLRLVGQVALCLKADPEGWREDVEATKMRTI